MKRKKTGRQVEEAAKIRKKKEGRILDAMTLSKLSDDFSKIVPTILVLFGFMDPDRPDIVSIILSIVMYLFFVAISVKLARKAENENE